MSHFVSLFPGWDSAITISVTLRTAVWPTSPDWESSIWTTTASPAFPEASLIWNTCRWVLTCTEAGRFTRSRAHPPCPNLPFCRWCTSTPTTSTRWVWTTSAPADSAWREHFITASASSLTPSTTGRCSPPHSAASLTGWPFSLATTRSKDQGILRGGKGME